MSLDSLKHVLYKVAFVPIAGIIALTSACGGGEATPTSIPPTATPRLAPTATPISSVIPLQQITPTPISTPTVTLRSLTETSLEDTLIKPSLDYMWVLEHDIFLNEMGKKLDMHFWRLSDGLIDLPEWLTQTENMGQISENFPEYREKFLKTLEEYEQITRNLGMFSPDILQFHNAKISLRPQISEVIESLNELNEEILKAEKYNDASVIRRDVIDKLKGILSGFHYLNEDHIWKTTFNQEVNPAMTIWIRYIETILDENFPEHTDGASFTVKYRDNTRSFTASGRKWIDIMYLTGKTDLPLVTLPVESPMVSQYNFNGFQVSILGFDNDVQLENAWNTFEHEEKETFENIELTKVFWKNNESSGNFYAYGKRVGDYILLINPTTNFWGYWNENEYSQLNNLIINMTSLK